MATFEGLLSAKKFAEIFQTYLSFRAVFWSKLVRLVMSVSAKEVNEKGELLWDKVTPKELEAPITKEALRAWLLAKPPLEAARWLRGLFDVRDPRAVSFEELIAITTEAAPDLLLEILPWPGSHDPMTQALYSLPGVVLGEVCAKRQIAAQGSYGRYLQFATDEAKGAYLRDAAKVLSGAEVRDVGGWLSPKAASLPAWIREAYAGALSASAAKQKKADSYHLYPYTKLLDRAGVEALLRATSKKAEVFQMVAAQVASQGCSYSADALASMLEDKKAGRAAALALASMGQEGIRAAKAWLASLTKKTTPGAALAQTLSELLAPPVSIWAGNQYSLPRFGRDPKQDLLPQTAVAAPRAEPTPLAKLQEAIQQSPQKSLLPPGGWADLLQLIALDPHLKEVPYAYERAKAKGRLGCGAEQSALVAALNELSWECVISKSSSSYDWGVGHVLLWAGASREVFLHALARFESTRAANVLGALQKHFGKALEQERPAWSKPMQTLLNHYNANRNETIFIGPPAVLASTKEEGASAELKAPSLNLWIRGEVQDATRFTLTFRESVKLTVDIEEEKWSLAKPKKQGDTPPLSASKGVSFVIETARDLMFLGIDGAVVTGAIDGLPKTNGPVQLKAEGKGARVTKLELLAKYSVVGADAAGFLLTSPGDKQAYTEVAGLQSPEAAHLLAAASLVLAPEQAEIAKKALTTMQGEGIDAWKKAVTPEEKVIPIGTKKEKVTPPTAFQVRSFEDVVKDFEALQLGAKARAKKPPVLRRGQTKSARFEYASFAPKPATEDWSARSAVPYPAVYLSEEAPNFEKIEYFVESLADLPGLSMKGRGTSANVSYVSKEDEYMIAALEIFPPEDRDDWVIMGGALGAAWKVEEGWVYALLGDNEAALAKLMGVEALPAHIGWKAARSVTVGDW